MEAALTDANLKNAQKISVGPEVTLVDACDAALVRENGPWHLGGTNSNYAKSYQGGYLHRLIMAPGPDEFVDHINGDCLDNRRRNLRIATRSENCANTAVVLNSTGYKGVAVYPKKKKRYQARLCKHGQVFRGPYRATAEEAARDYDGLARGIHGPFAAVNFPIENERGVDRPGGVA